MGRKDEKKSAVDPGPWLARDLETFAVTTVKKQCGLCELWFAVENLPGLCSWRAVLEKKRFGDADSEAKLKTWASTRLYSSCKLCIFCTQLLQPPDEE